MDQIVALLNDITSDFLFLNPDDVDVPTAGKFMNKLDAITKEAEQAKAAPVKAISVSLNNILERMVLDKIEDKPRALQIFSRGISVMQELLDHYRNSGTFAGDITDVLAEIASLTGIAPPVAAAGLLPQPEPAAAPRACRCTLAPTAGLMHSLITRV